MEQQFNLNTFKVYYSSLLEYICSDEDFLKSGNKVSNIWKTTDRNFLQLVGSFFSKQPDPIKALLPSSNLYSAILSYCEKNDDQELLKWVKSFNNLFLTSVAKAIKKNKAEDLLSFNDYLRFCSDMFYKLKTKNENLEKLVAELQNELRQSQEKNIMLASTLENLADEECENFRKRMRTKISSLNSDYAATV
jgi:glutaredoxin 2